MANDSISQHIMLEEKIGTFEEIEIVCEGIVLKSIYLHI